MYADISIFIFSATLKFYTEHVTRNSWIL